MNIKKTGAIRLPMKDPSIYQSEHDPFLYGNIAKRDVIETISRKAISSLTHLITKNYKTGLFLLLLGIAPQIQAQQHTIDTTLRLEEVTVTGSRTERPVNQSPGSISVISPVVLNNSPANTIDDILTMVSGINTTRSTGIAQWRTNISVRGLSGNEQGRTLVLLDGIPLNSTGSGTVNWNTIHMDNVQRIEVFKGPGSSLYGNNAMGGVINIISKKAISPFNLTASASYGSMSTQLYNLGLSSKLSKTFSLYLSGYYNQTDGYNPTPKDKRTKPDYSIDRYMKEGGFYSKLTFSPTEKFNIDVSYDLYRDKRSEGERIQHPSGRYREQPYHHITSRFYGNGKVFSYNLALYYQQEDFYKMDERMRKGKYVRIDTKSLDKDWGGIASFSFTGKHNSFTIGGEYKNGSLDGRDDYMETPDWAINKGTMNFISAFAQNEISFLHKMFWLQLALRYDNVYFHKGLYQTEGENVSAFQDYSGPLKSNRWENYSPRIALRFNPIEAISFYTSFSQGFKAAMLDDLCRSGQIWIGPKIANPDLKPEKLDNYEVGAHLRLFRHLTLSPAFYYAHGKDFQYYINTGEQLWDGRDIFRRQNISEIKMKGAEVDLTYSTLFGLRANVNYSYNESKIKNFRNQPEYNNKLLTYAPLHQVKGSILWTGGFLDLTLRGQYKTKQYTSEDNNSSIPGFSVWDVQAAKWLFHHHLRFSCDVINLFNTRNMNTKDTMSSGRLVNVKLTLNV